MLKRWVRVCSILLGLLTASSCGGKTSVAVSGIAADDISITFSPEDTSTGVAPNVSITAIFSAAITAPSDWGAVFTLRDGNGTQLTTTVVYDSSTLTATLTHDELDAKSSYTIAISGLAGVTEATTTFTTGPEIAVTMAKTSVASISAGNDVTLTFTFASAVPTGWAPAVSVTDPDSTNLMVSGCTFNGGRTSYSCTVSGIAGCTTFSDYTVTVTGTGGFTTTFNSADDEFEASGTLTNCWVRANNPEGTFSITEDGNLDLVVAFGGTGERASDSIFKSLSDKTDIAVLTQISSVTRPAGGSGETKITMGLRECINCSGDSLSLSVASYNGDDKWQLGINIDGYVGTEPLIGGELGASRTSDGPLYVCMVRYHNSAKTYLSTDGSNYIRLSADNMECVSGCTDVSGVVEAPAGWATTLELLGSNSVASSTLSGEYGYSRFKTTGITGTSSADCPAL